MRTVPESRLVVAARSGDVEAQHEVARRYWDAAFRVALLLTQDHGAAEDLAQEAILSALGALGSFDEDRSLKPWIQRIAANKAYDWLRQRERRPEVIDVELVEQAQSGSIADAIADAAPSEELAAALARLDPRFRTAVVMRHALGYEPDEIGEILSVAPATIRTRIHRGLTQLHERLIEGGRNEQAG